MTRQRTKRKIRTQYRKRRTGQKTKRKRGVFLKRYDLAYAGRDTVNQTTKISPGVIKAATNDINKIAEQRINEIINHGGKKIDRVLPKILRGAIEDVYQTPFRLLDIFGKQQLGKIKRTILK